MRVVAILGSPRTKSNSSFLAKLLVGEMEKAGAQATIHFLNTLRYRGCQACGACKGGSRSCILADDLTEVLADFQTNEVVVLASPVYWGEVSGQLKLFFDRMYSYLTPDFMTAEKKHRLPQGKTLVWVQSQGADASLHKDVFERYNLFWQQLGFFAKIHILRVANCGEQGAVMARQDALDEALRIGREILG